MSHPNVFMTGQLCNLVYVHSSLCQLGTEAMPQIVKREIFNLCFSCGLVKSPSEIVTINFLTMTVGKSSVFTLEDAIAKELMQAHML